MTKKEKEAPEQEPVFRPGTPFLSLSREEMDAAGLSDDDVVLADQLKIDRRELLKNPAILKAAREALETKARAEPKAEPKVEHAPAPTHGKTAHE